MSGRISRQLKVRHEFVLKLVVFGVGANGLLFITSTLANQFVTRLRPHNVGIAVGLPLIIGLTLLYLSSLLARRKRAAWAIAIPLYAFILTINILQLIEIEPDRHLTLLNLLRNVVVPIIVVVGLVLSRAEFTVKSDIRNFALSLRFSIAIMLVALVYGVVGFQLMDKHDFRQEMGIGESIHRTIDQFGLTTTHQLTPHTRRARVFLDSLSIISVGAATYAIISLFQPLRWRLTDQTPNREIMHSLLVNYPASSEDFFKLWPHDKFYFFNATRTAGLAFHPKHGIALVVGDPAGSPAVFDSLLDDFDELCRVNDWSPAYIHTEPHHSSLYRRHEFNLQKIGEEATVDLHHFNNEVLRNKYFRHICNKFEKLGYTAELLQPPHHDAVISRLKVISQDWLSQPGRAERRFMMGYFTPAYMELCPLMVLRDGAGTIQAFLNQIPSFAKHEANFDLLRHTNDSPGNINDFLLVNFIKELIAQEFTHLNLGLCPLAGLSEKEEDGTVIDSALRFVYANGDRFYSFSGLHRFKAKYEPNWNNRYVAYRGGVGGFTRTLNALNSAMKVHKF